MIEKIKMFNSSKKLLLFIYYYIYHNLAGFDLIS